MYDAIEARLLRGESGKRRGVVEIDERYEGGSVTNGREGLTFGLSERIDTNWL